MLPSSLNKLNYSNNFSQPINNARIDDESNNDFNHNFYNDYMNDFNADAEYNELKEMINLLYDNQRNDIVESKKQVTIEKDSEKYYEYNALQQLFLSDLHFEARRSDSEVERLNSVTLVKEFDTDETPIIHICGYQVNTEGKNPFLQFFMQKQEDKISFPKFKYNPYIDSLDRAKSVLDIMIFSYQTLEPKIYNGYLQEQNNYYLFFDCSECQIKIHDLYNKNDTWLIAMDEIVNTRIVCGNFYIDPNVTEFFHNHPDFIYLQDSNKNNYENPVIVYTGDTSFQANYISMFGTPPSDAKSLFGPYYYFYDYQAAVRMALKNYKSKKEQQIDKEPMTIMNWSAQPISLEGGIVRSAIFTGQIKTILQATDDKPDMSQTTQDMLKEDPTCASMEHRSLVNYLHISDRDGTWTKNYDSIFLGDVDLNDNSVKKYASNMFAIKEYEQQLPLTCHFFAAKTMEQEWSDNTAFYLIK